jgi:DNA-binding transcriptional MerR regulator
MELAPSTIPIQRAAELSGLSSSTLRYYEEVGLLGPIERTSTDHRRYSETDIDLAIAIACLRATGMSVLDIRTYLQNRQRGDDAAQEQLTLLVAQQKRLIQEAALLRLRRQYLDAKVDYWRSVTRGDESERSARSQEVAELAQRLHSTSNHQTSSSSEKNE